MQPIIPQVLTTDYETNLYVCYKRDGTNLNAAIRAWVHRHLIITVTVLLCKWLTIVIKCRCSLITNPSSKHVFIWKVCYIEHQFQHTTTVEKLLEAANDMLTTQCPNEKFVIKYIDLL